MMDKWNELARPPKSALKQIQAGRLKGMSDVNPQWRYKAMHDAYGPCGEGWKYEIVDLWTEPGLEGQMFMFAKINVYVADSGSWSDPIPGVGGSMLLEKDKYGIHHNDEAVKMAVTDALSVALKMLGVASDIYLGRWDGSKYKEEEKPPVDIEPDMQVFLHDLSREVVSLCKSGDFAEAQASIDNAGLDPDSETYLWSKMHDESGVRSGLKSYKAIIRAKTPDELMNAWKSTSKENQPALAKYKDQMKSLLLKEAA